VPSERGANPAETPTPEPAEEPPQGYRCVSGIEDILGGYTD